MVRIFIRRRQPINLSSLPCAWPVANIPASLEADHGCPRRHRFEAHPVSPHRRIGRTPIPNLQRAHGTSPMRRSSDFEFYAPCGFLIWTNAKVNTWPPLSQRMSSKDGRSSTDHLRTDHPIGPRTHAFRNTLEPKFLLPKFLSCRISH